MREPTIAWWPQTVPAGASCDEVATAMDLLPTFAKLAGTAPPQDRILDGKDIAPLLLGKAEAKSPHEAFYYYDPGRRLRAVRSGPWKLWHNGRLYNLEKGIGERRNVAKQHPDVVARLEKLLAQAREDLGDGGTAGKNCRPVGVAKNPRTLLPRPGVEGDAAYAPAGPHDRKRKN
jgi:arylsulfatase A-like enzyme